MLGSRYVFTRHCFKPRKSCFNKQHYLNHSRMIHLLVCLVSYHLDIAKGIHVELVVSICPHILMTLISKESIVKLLFTHLLVVTLLSLVRGKFMSQEVCCGETLIPMPPVFEDNRKSNCVNAMGKPIILLFFLY